MNTHQAPASMSPMLRCQHTNLILDGSPFAAEAGYVRPPRQKRLAATRPSGRIPAVKAQGPKNGQDADAADARTSPGFFPGPLVLPDDDLALDPKFPPQSLRSWIREKARNRVTRRRNIIYVAAPPTAAIDDGEELTRVLEDWPRPVVKEEGAPGKRKKNKAKRTQNGHNEGNRNPPKADDIREYLSAFYHGIPVAAFPTPLRFVPWTENKAKRRKTGSSSKKGDASSSNQDGEDYVGLAAGAACTRIRTRPCPDGAFARQLNLDDILDAAIEMLPPDAYAILLMVDHDIYENDEDDFCCGRAYGSSRVCVTSSARYNPVFDESAGMRPEHAWPASHCQEYIDVLLSEQEQEQEQGPESIPSVRESRGYRSGKDDDGLDNRADHLTNPVGALRSAVAAAEPLLSAGPLPGTAHPYGVWLSRFCRTASHELGHCLGMEHCVYYACSMQGTSCMAEDLRQPPYLCPVCLAKLSRAVAIELRGAREGREGEYVAERYGVLLKYCDRWSAVAMFCGFAAWLRVRMDDVVKGPP